MLTVTRKHKSSHYPLFVKRGLALKIRNCIYDIFIFQVHFEKSKQVQNKSLTEYDSDLYQNFMKAIVNRKIKRNLPDIDLRILKVKPKVKIATYITNLFITYKKKNFFLKYGQSPSFLTESAVYALLRILHNKEKLYFLTQKKEFDERL